jgi:hypothetical protein
MGSLLIYYIVLSSPKKYHFQFVEDKQGIALRNLPAVASPLDGSDHESWLPTMPGRSWQGSLTGGQEVVNSSPALGILLSTATPN